MAAAGVPPRVMGIGPVPASRKLMARLGGVDRGFRHYRTERGLRRAGTGGDARNSALPTTPITSTPMAGAIALGHPLGMSGARIVGTAALEIAARGASRGARHHVHRALARALPAPSRRREAAKRREARARRHGVLTREGRCAGAALFASAGAGPRDPGGRHGRRDARSATCASRSASQLSISSAPAPGFARPPCAQPSTSNVWKTVSSGSARQSDRPSTTR